MHNLEKEVRAELVDLNFKSVAFQAQSSFIKEENGILQVEIPDGEKFLPRFLNEIVTKIDSIELRKPTLDDVFLSLTGRALRDEKSSSKDRMREKMRIRGGR